MPEQLVEVGGWRWTVTRSGRRQGKHERDGRWRRMRRRRKGNDRRKLNLMGKRSKSSQTRTATSPPGRGTFKERVCQCACESVPAALGWAADFFLGWQPKYPRTRRPPQSDMPDLLPAQPSGARRLPPPADDLSWGTALSCPLAANEKVRTGRVLAPRFDATNLNWSALVRCSQGPARVSWLEEERGPHRTGARLAFACQGYFHVLGSHYSTPQRLELLRSPIIVRATDEGR